jgi:hypothetical protein
MIYEFTYLDLANYFTVHNIFEDEKLQEKKLA